MEKNKISPAQRAAMFAQMTRQNMQMLPSVAGAANATVSIDIPRTKLLSKVMLLIQGTITNTLAAGTDAALDAFAPYGFIRSARVKMNNGFSPFQVSGKGLYMYNLCNINADQIPLITGAGNIGDSRSRTTCGVKTGAGGEANSFKMLVELPLTLNDRDPIGLILAQNAETLINVELDLGAVTDIVPTAAGLTSVLSAVTITPMTVSYTVPTDANALPDLSVLKLVHEAEQSISGSGQQVVKLPVGNTYRKLFAWIENASGVGVTDASLSGNFDLMFNQADIPYSVKPSVLAGLNQQAYGKLLPQGLWVFDFSNNGLPGLGGSRDLIDTERLSELWFRFNAAVAGKVKIVYETLSQMR